MEEPSVLDYLIERISFWKEKTVEIPLSIEDVTFPPGAEGKGEPRKTFLDRTWVVLLPVLLALTAQFVLEPPKRSPEMGIILYLIAVLCLLVLIRRDHWQIPSHSTPDRIQDHDRIRLTPLLIGGMISLFALFLFIGNQFTLLNVALWITAFLFIWRGLWLPEGWVKRFQSGWRQVLQRGIQLSSWKLLLILVFVIAAYFRFYLLRQVPPEMFSDHAEKLLDVSDVLRGNLSIFFPRNTGREGFQIYLTAAVSKIFGTGLSFLSLKIGTTLAGFLTLPYIYLLGKEYANRRVGLFALFFAGIAYWPNVISRVALRFTLYPFFAAPALYYFIRGLRRGRRNDFIYSGIALGFGLHGYSPFRIMPLIIVAAGILYFLHHTSKEGFKRSLTAVIFVGLISLMIFLPLLGYILPNYHDFSYRMGTRITSLERPLPGPVWKIFITNTLKALVMFQWENGGTWVHSVPHRPALGIVAGALFTLGIVIVVFRYMRNRHWMDLLMLALIPLFLLTSILSLAFPDENPSLNRTSGAIIPVFLIIGMAVDGLYTTVNARFNSSWGKKVSIVLVVILMVMSATHNYTLVFEDYYQQFWNNAWNSSQIGAVIKDFYSTIGEDDHAWVVPFPHWVDTRLVGIRAEKPLRDYALWPEYIPSTQHISGPKLYIVKPEDKEAQKIINSLYPEAIVRRYKSNVPGRDFLMYYVFPNQAD